MHTRRLVKGMFVTLMVLSPLSCGRRNGGKPVYPVRGQVFFLGKPTAGALVLFHPLDDPDAPGPRPHGQVEQDGTFRLTTYEVDDGAPAGAYVVTIDWRKGIPGQGRLGPALMPAKYGTPKQSPLRATVQAESNDLAAFQISR